jgi:HSP20 family protein
MQVRRWDPFTVLAKMDRDFDEVVRRTWGEQGRVGATFVPPVEVVREGSDVVVRFELPGIDVERDVTIEVERGKLVVSGERRDKGGDGGERQLLVRELRYGQFRREFALPGGVSPEQVEAGYDAGMLEVRVHAVIAPEPTPVRVPISTGRAPQQQVVEHEQPQAVEA